MFSTITGIGDYSDNMSAIPYPVMSNTIVGRSTPLSAQVPRMYSDHGAVRIQHREFCFDLPMTVLFTNKNGSITPDNQQLFPWLYLIANQFENYKWLGLVFEFRSLSANAISGASAGMGSVSMATIYDSYSAPYVSKVQANNALFATSCKPSESMFHPVECDPDMTPTTALFTRPDSGAPGIRDTRFESLGSLNIITIGAPAAYPVCGEIWCTYDILLIKPRVPGN